MLSPRTLERPERRRSRDAEAGILSLSLRYWSLSWGGACYINCHDPNIDPLNVSPCEMKIKEQC